MEHHKIPENCHHEHLSEECIIRHQKQDELNQQIKDIHDALLGTALSTEPSIKEKVNEIYDERKTVKKWVAGSLLTIVVFIFSLGSIYERFNSIKRTIDDLTIRIQHLENLHHQGGFNNANIGKN